MTRLALAFLLLAVPVLAAEAPYLTPEQVDLMHLLPPPPPPGSVRQAEELAFMHGLESTRSTARVAQAQSDVDESVRTMFGAILGADFDPGGVPPDPGGVPLTMALFRRLAATEEAVVQPAKAGFHRARPYIADPTLNPVLSRPTNDSYPSGHTSRSTVMGIVLARMVPERSAAIFARMLDYSESRVIGGVHFPSDLVAGRQAGTAIDAVLFTDPAFLADFAPARAELRRALGLP